jgi:tRNA (guanine-N7-)-methyltransferase
VNSEHHTVLRPGIRTFKPRRSRITSRQSQALAHQRRWLLEADAQPLDLLQIFGRPVLLEIGFGTGTATARMAAADRGLGVLAIDVHTPGVGNLLDLIGRDALDNVRVMEADALDVLRRQVSPGGLVGVRSYFPDPWPKSRHHKRRLVQQPVMDLVRDRIEPGGFWHLATDWDEYVEFIEAAFAADDAWSGGRIARPDWRPITHYEARAVRAGRRITDLLFHGRITP